MKLASAQNAVQPRSVAARNVAWAYAGVLVVMAVGQLFGFEKFIPLLAEYSLLGNEGGALLAACLIVIAEVFALPFLLRMHLSPFMRWLSLLSGIVAAGAWLLLSVSALVAGDALANGGVLGVKVAIPAGVAQLAWTVGLCGLAGWSVWGLWPLHKK